MVTNHMNVFVGKIFAIRKTTIEDKGDGSWNCWEEATQEAANDIMIEKRSRSQGRLQIGGDMGNHRREGRTH